MKYKGTYISVGMNLDKKRVNPFSIIAEVDEL